MRKPLSPPKKWQMGMIWHITQNTQFYLTKQNLLRTLFLQPTRQRVFDLMFDISVCLHWTTCLQLHSFLVQSLLFVLPSCDPSATESNWRRVTANIWIILVYQHRQHPFARLSFQPPMCGYVCKHIILVSVIDSELVLQRVAVIIMCRIESTMISTSKNRNIHTIISPDALTSKAKWCTASSCP